MAPTTGQRRDQATPRECRRAPRRGLSLLEFLGCLIAIVGGAWLGAIYMGMDVRRLVYTAMAQSEALDNVPPEWRLAGPDKAVTREQMVAALREELGKLRGELADLRRDDQPPVRGRSNAQPDPSAAPQSSKSRTLAYWVRLNEIILGEAGLQQDAESAFTMANATKVFAIKERVSRFAARAVEAIPTDQVDASVLQFGRQLQQWYEQGSALYERAAGIWQLPLASQRTQLNRGWSQAELQHQNEANLLGDKAATLRDTLSRQFNVEFSPLAAPAHASGSRHAGEEPEG
jgi:uncharacterized membrane protein